QLDRGGGAQGLDLALGRSHQLVDVHRDGLRHDVSPVAASCRHTKVTADPVSRKVCGAVPTKRRRRGPGPRRRTNSPLPTRRSTMPSQYENATMATTAAPTHSAGHNAPDSVSST